MPANQEFFWLFLLQGGYTAMVFALAVWMGR